METWTTACTAFNLAPVVSHYVGLNFIPGVEHTAIRTQTIDKLGSDLAEQLFEAAYMAQTTVMYNNEAGLALISGEVPNPPPDTIFGKNEVKMNFLGEAALQEAEEMARPTKPEYTERREESGGGKGGVSTCST